MPGHRRPADGACRLRPHRASFEPEAAPVSDPHFTGYTVAYDRDEAPFPVYLMAFLAAVLFAGAVVVSNTIMFALGAAAFAVASSVTPLR